MKQSQTVKNIRNYLTLMNAIFLDSFTFFSASSFLVSSSFFAFPSLLFSFRLFNAHMPIICLWFSLIFIPLLCFALTENAQRSFDLSFRFTGKTTSKPMPMKNCRTSKTCYLLYDEINQVFAQVDVMCVVVLASSEESIQKRRKRLRERESELEK